MARRERRGVPLRFSLCFFDPFADDVGAVGDKAVRAERHQRADDILGVDGPERGLAAGVVELVDHLRVGEGGVVLATDQLHRETQRPDIGSGFACADRVARICRTDICG